MKYGVEAKGAYSYFRVVLEPGERFVSESGAMVRASANVETDVTTKSKNQGGILGGLKRLVSGDSFFLSTYHAEQGKPGEVVVAPTHVGDCFVLDLQPGEKWSCTGASWLASGPEVGLETKFQGMKGFFTGESMFFMEATGPGPLVVNAFGCIREVEIDGEYIIDTGHVVAIGQGLEYEITKAGGSWLQSFLAGEGLVMKFRGKGRVLVQSHNASEFGKAIGPSLPERSA